MFLWFGFFRYNLIDIIYKLHITSSHHILHPTIQQGHWLLGSFSIQNGTGKWAVGGITQAKTQTDVLLQNGNFKGEHTGCSIVVREASISI